MMANGAWQVQSSRATKFDLRKLNFEAILKILLFTKINTLENFPLYGILPQLRHQSHINQLAPSNAGTALPVGRAVVN